MFIKNALGILFLSGLFLVCLLISHTSSFILPPQPVDTVIRWKTEEDERKEQGAKEEWIEQLHRAAPGLNWREADRATREKKYQSYLASGYGSSKTAANDTLANGNLIGEWKERGSLNQAGRMMVAWLDVGSNKIYAGSAGGMVWKGNADGTGWKSLNDQLRMPSLRLVRTIPTLGGKRLLAASGGSTFYYSDDDGMTWGNGTGMENIQNWGNIRRALVADDSLQTIYVLSREWDYDNWNAMTALYLSTDKGSSFKQIQTWGDPTFGGSENFDIWVPTYGASPAYLVQNDSIFTLATGDTTLQYHSTLSLNSTGRTLLTGYHKGSTTWLYLYVDEDIYKSTDAGLNWTFVSNIAKGAFTSNSFSCSVTDSTRLWFGDIECHRSSDGGQNWTKVNDWWTYYGSVVDQLHADIPSIIPLLDQNGNEFQYVCTDGGMYISTDFTQNVTNLSLIGQNVSQYYSVYTDKNDPNYIYAGSQDQGFQRCQLDSGTVLEFDQLISGDYGHIVSGDEGKSIWMVYPGFADYYLNAHIGSSVANWNFNGSNPFWMPPLMSDPDHSTRCYLAGGFTNSGSGSHMLNLRYFAGQINAIEHPYDFSAASSGGNISAMEFSSVNEDYWYVALDNGDFFHSTDKGNTWSSTFAVVPGSHYFYGNSVHASKTNLGTVYVAGSGYSTAGVRKSTDHGATFTAIDNGLPSTMIYQIDGNADETLLFAATEVGPYVYVVAENTWYEIGNGKAPDQTYWTVEYIPLIHTVRYGTYGRGIWDFAEVPPPVGFNPSPLNQGPISIYPNPAIEFLNVEFSLANEESMKITIVDLECKVVITQAFLAKTGDNLHQLNVSGLSAGLYLCVVEGEKWRSVEKVIVN